MKIFYYAIILTGVILLLNLAGMDLPSGGLVSSLGLSSPENFKSSTLWTTLISVLGLAAGVGIIIGTFTRTPPESYLIAGFLALFAGFVINDLVHIAQQLSATGDPIASAISILIISPLILGFLISTVEWWRGAD